MNSEPSLELKLLSVQLCREMMWVCVFRPGSEGAKFLQRSAQEVQQSLGLSFLNNMFLSAFNSACIVHMRDWILHAISNELAPNAGVQTVLVLKQNLNIADAQLHPTFAAIFNQFVQNFNENNPIFIQRRVAFSTWIVQVTAPYSWEASRMFGNMNVNFNALFGLATADMSMTSETSPSTLQGLGPVLGRFCDIMVAPSRKQLLEAQAEAEKTKAAAEEAAAKAAQIAKETQEFEAKVAQEAKTAQEAKEAKATQDQAKAAQEAIHHDHLSPQPQYARPLTPRPVTPKPVTVPVPLSTPPMSPPVAKSGMGSFLSTRDLARHLPSISGTVSQAGYDSMSLLKLHTLPPARAQYNCGKKNLRQLLGDLNSLMNIHRSLDEEGGPGLQADLEVCSKRGLDFGTAYGLLRTRWEYVCPHCDDTTYYGLHNSELGTRYNGCACILCTYASASAPWDDIKHLENHVIAEPYSKMPRRMWDLCSDRIVPLSAMYQPQCEKCSYGGNLEPTSRLPKFIAISHSWTDDMSGVKSPINQGQWEVPLPKGLDLEDIREHVLELGAQYAWLDALCLRQESDPASELRRRIEWATDIPTIGNIYRKAVGILRYFNGLGRELQATGWDSPRHWLNRAWTLQEIRPEVKMFTGGVPQGMLVPMNLLGEVTVKSDPPSVRDIDANEKVTPPVKVKVTKRLRDLVTPLAQIALEAETAEGCSVLSLTRQMAHRFSTKEVDKIAGIGYLLRATTLPAYDGSESPEQAWAKCVTHMPYLMKLEILFNFPYPRSLSPPPEEVKDDRLRWLPTWEQMMKLPEVNFNPRRPKCPLECHPSENELEAYGFNMVEYRAGIAIMNCQIKRVTSSDSKHYEFSVSPVRRSQRSEDVYAGFYSPYPLSLVEGREYVLVAQGGYTELEDRTWIVCEEKNGKHDLRNLRDRMESLWDNKGITDIKLNEEALILEKYAILMTDDARVLLGPKNVTMESCDLEALNYDVRVEPLCYFI